MWTGGERRRLRQVGLGSSVLFGQAEVTSTAAVQSWGGGDCSGNILDFVSFLIPSCLQNTRVLM